MTQNRLLTMAMPQRGWRATMPRRQHQSRKQHALLIEAMGYAGDRVVVRSPFLCDYGYNLHLNDGLFLNFGCVIHDVVAVRIGAETKIGPCVQILAADHPRDSALRDKRFEFGYPATIGDDAIVCAGSVVIRDVAAFLTLSLQATQKIL